MPHMLLLAQKLTWKEHSSNLKMLQRTNECYTNKKLSPIHCRRIGLLRPNVTTWAVVMVE